MGSTSKMPRMPADRIIGQAAPDRMHQREKMDDDMNRGTIARKRASAPTTDVKKRRTRGSGPGTGRGG